MRSVRRTDRRSCPRVSRLVRRTGVLLSLLLAGLTACGDDDQPSTPPPNGASFHPTSDVSIGGVLDVSEFIVPAGVTVTVTGDLSVSAAGPVLIAGSLRGAGVSVEIRGTDSLRVTGEVRLLASSDSAAAEPALTLVGNGRLALEGARLQAASMDIRNDPSLDDDDFPEGGAAPATAGSPGDPIQGQDGPDASFGPGASGGLPSIPVQGAAVLIHDVELIPSPDAARAGRSGRAGGSGAGGEGAPPGDGGVAGGSSLSVRGVYAEAGEVFTEGADGTPCPDPTGACCAAGGACAIQTRAGCETAQRCYLGGRREVRTRTPASRR